MYYGNPEFPVVAGLVQFTPRCRQANGHRVRDIVVQEFGSQRVTTITLWPEFAHIPLDAGDLVVVQGKRRVWTHTDQGGWPSERSGIDARTLRVIREESAQHLAAAVG